MEFVTQVIFSAGNCLAETDCSIGMNSGDSLGNWQRNPLGFGLDVYVRDKTNDLVKNET